MKRILVIGSPGAGKSTFARRLGDATGLGVIHLDQLYWKPNWVETTDKDEWQRVVTEVLKGESWIIDGNYGGTMEMRLAACDTAIFLDFPNYICTWRVLKRFIKYRNQTRPDIAEGCDEKIDLEFLKWTWEYPKRSKGNVERRLKNFKGKVVRLSSGKEIENFFSDTIKFS